MSNLRRRGLTAEQRQAQSQRMKAAWRDGKFDGRYRGTRGDHWTPEQDAILRDLAGTVPREQLHAAWMERTGLPRTHEALVVRCQRIGASMWVHGWSLRSVERLFGTDHRMIIRNWVQTGELPGSRWRGRGPNEGWWFNESDIERFIREYPWRYDWTRMQRDHRLATIAELVNRADPWRSYAELVEFVGIASGNVDKWRRRGLVPHRFRPKAGHSPQVMIRGRDFPLIRDAIRAAQEDARERSRRAASKRMRDRNMRDDRGRMLRLVA